jgi:hypothetical protein
LNSLILSIVFKQSFNGAGKLLNSGSSTLPLNLCG